MRSRYLKSWRTNVRRGSRILASLLLVVTSGSTNIWLAKAAHAVSDTTPMYFTSLLASTNTVNVNNGVSQVLFEGPTADDISGYGYVEFYYTSPSGAQVYEGSAGSDGSGNFSGSLDFQQYAEPGIWKPTFTLADASGNTQTLSSAELAQLGFNLDINVVSDTPDLTAPELVAYDGAGASLSLTDTPDRLELHATVTDDLSGSTSILARFVSPSGNQVIKNVNAGISPTDPNVRILNPEFYHLAEQGAWTTYLTLRDKVGNTVNYDADDFEAVFGNRMDIQISTQQSDTTPLSVHNLSFDAANPESENVPEGGAIISTIIDISDNLSGIGPCRLVYRSQSSGQTSEEIGMTLDDSGVFRLNVQLPPYAAGGIWLPEVITSDLAGNIQTLHHEDLLAMGYDLTVNLTQNVSDNLAPGESVTTDANDTGATPTTPVQSMVETPVEGLVSIVTLDLDPTVSATNGYLLIGQQVNIHAPAATPEAPLSLTFQVEGSILESGQTADNLAIFRNGNLVEACTDPVIATPDPCVYSRTTLADGDIEITVHTSTASAWTLGFATTQDHLFKGFEAPLKKSPVLNKANSGESIPVKFDFGTNEGQDILQSGIATTQEINCETRELIGESTPALSTNGQGLKLLGENHYRYNWKTLKKWEGTCRQLSLNFTNGEVATAYFNFNQ